MTDPTPENVGVEVRRAYGKHELHADCGHQKFPLYRVRVGNVIFQICPDCIRSLIEVLLKELEGEVQPPKVVIEPKGMTWTRRPMGSNKKLRKARKLG